MNNIILIGMMSCGKSTIGRLLAQRLGRELVDTDALIEEREGRSILDIFAAEGEGCFRDRERDVARELAGREELVISCGGGLPIRAEAIAPLRDSGTVLWLNRDPGRTYDTMDTVGRPLARQGREAFLECYAQRAPIYRQWAHHVITEFSSPNATLEAVLEVLSL